ncbi:ABC transporter permease subunit [Leifsonia sp. NPDC058248]|uniref:ABC transporter permease subunit n=1 Tax=Leifsonia sp. NPDC058248 TaxID=3346402 RepID=UPI0036DBDD86
MSTAVASPTRHTSLGHLTFPRVVRSEWIKFRTLRSTFWSYAIVLVLGIGLTALVAFSFPESQVSQMPDAAKASFVSSTALFGVYFGQLIVAVLGVLAISGEYSTGMIRSSFAAVPRRTPVFVAKSIVLFVSSFVVGIVTTVAGYAIAGPVLSGKGFPVDITQSDTVWAILGAGAYLGLVSVFALGLGTLLRSAAGGIAAALGVVFLLPIIVNILHSLLSTVDWIGDVPKYLISDAGQAMAGSGGTTLDPWQNVLVVLVWTAVSFIAGAIVMKRRDA